jgi:transposase
MLYLAIDQHRKQLTVNLRNEQGDVILKRQVSTEWKRVREFMEGVRNRSVPEGGFVAIVEVCGFNDWFLKLLAEYGCREVVLVQPEKRTKNKTDRRDANALGELLWTNRLRLREGKKVQNVRRVVPPSQRDAEDRQLTIMRHRLGRLRTRTINRVQHLLLKHNLQQECPTKGLKSQSARNWLAKLPLGVVDRAELDQLLAQWELWDRQIEEMEPKIRERQAENTTAAIVATVPGAAAYSSLWHMLKHQQPYRSSGTSTAGNDPGCGCKPPDRNAFFEAQQGRSRGRKQKGCHGSVTAAAARP